MKVRNPNTKSCHVELLVRKDNAEAARDGVLKY